MPRIDAATIEEHVQLQTSRILDAARELFRTRGYGQTDLDSIARAVGLARNSLYRYYPSKDHILLACLSVDMEVYLEQIRSLETQHPVAAELIAAWLDMQIDMVTSPAHATLEMMSELESADPTIRQAIRDLHDAPLQVLEAAVGRQLRGSRRDLSLVVAIVRGMVEAAAGQALRRDNKLAVKRELRRAVQRVVGH